MQIYFFYQNALEITPLAKSLIFSVNYLTCTYFVHLQSELDAKAVVEGRQGILLASSYLCVASSCTAPLGKK